MRNVDGLGAFVSVESCKNCLCCLFKFETFS